MSLNPIQRLAKWLMGPPEAGGPSAGASERRCAAGHWMDPSWPECPYCSAERNVRRPTRDYKTRVERPAEDAGRPGGNPGANEDSRAIVGVLVTFSWRRAGQLFPVYEGKNLIGSGRAPEHRCDVRVSSDDTLSREHALIRCLGGQYEIFDQKSENGTSMNGQRVPVTGMPLENGAILKTGATVWTFQMIRVPGDLAEDRPEKHGPTPRQREEEIVDDELKSRRQPEFEDEPGSVEDSEPVVRSTDEGEPERPLPGLRRPTRIGSGDDAPASPAKGRPTRIL